MDWNLGRIYLHLKSNTKLTTLPTLCDTGKLDHPWNFWCDYSDQFISSWLYIMEGELKRNFVPKLNFTFVALS